MAENWLDDVRKYAADADEAVVNKIVSYLGIALRNRDSSLVSFSDKTETDRVRENYLKKKLGLTHSDADLDSAIAEVGQVMKADRTKNRVTVYYLLAEKFGLLNVFGGVAKGVGAAAAGAAAVAATAKDKVEDVVDGAGDKLAAAGAAVAGAAAVAAAAPAKAVEEVQTAYTNYDNGDVDIGDPGGMGWLKWLLLAALVAAAIFFLMRYCNKHDAAPVAGDNVTVGDTLNTTDATTNGADATVNTTAAVPVGSAVAASERDGKPMLTVYFDTGKSEVHKDLSTAAAAVKAYADANPAATLAVSGFNDPTGNAAKNAELSKSRAQNVKAALEKIGIAPERIVLEKPAEASGTGATNAESRRVEVVVKS